MRDSLGVSCAVGEIPILAAKDAARMGHSGAFCHDIFDFNSWSAYESLAASDLRGLVGAGISFGADGGGYCDFAKAAGGEGGSACDRGQRAQDGGQLFLAAG